MRAGQLTPRATQVLDAVRAAGAAGIAKRELCASLGMSRNNADHYLHKLRCAGLVDNTARRGAATWTSRWFDTRLLDAVDIETPRQRRVKAADCPPIQTTGSRGAFWR